jgi:hypothetical protein
MAKKQQQRRALAIGQTIASVVSPTDAVVIGKGFKATANGLIIQGTPKFESWESTMNRLRVAEKAAPFALGDGIIWGETHFDEKASQVLDESSGWSLKTISVYRWLASRIASADRRMDRLGVSHHLLVAALTPVKQRQWLKLAAADEEDHAWTVARMRKAMKEGEDLPAEKFWVLVSANDISDQNELMERLQGEGRACKAVVRRERK